ncbi:MAG: hypothetical protein MHPSP_004519, partial [Paramarteilia canceri]
IEEIDQKEVLLAQTIHVCSALQPFCQVEDPGYVDLCTTMIAMCAKYGNFNSSKILSSLFLISKNIMKLN